MTFKTRNYVFMTKRLKPLYYVMPMHKDVDRCVCMYIGEGLGLSWLRRWYHGCNGIYNNGLYYVQDAI